MTPTKRCRLCGGEFPATPAHFYVRASSRDGFRNECKACLKKLNKARYAANPEKYIAKQRQYWKTHREARREYQRQWRARNPEKLREKNRRYYARNREKQLEANRRWYYNHRDARIRQTTAYAKAHPEQTRQYQAAYRQSSKYRTRYRRYYAEHKEQIAQYGRQWTSANPERHRARIRRYRARKVGANGFHTAEDIATQYRAQNGRCWWCSCELEEFYHVDHLTPLSRGGSNAPENIVITCPSCNLSKGNKMPHEWCGRLF